MKKVLSSILISFVIFANLLAPISVGVGKEGIEINKNEARATDACIIKNFSFSPKGGPNEKFPDVVSLSLNTENCIGKRVVIGLYELSGNNETVFNISRDNNYKLLENDFVLNLTPTEKSCKDGKCRIEFYVALHDIDSGLLVASYTSKSADVEKELDYNCKTNSCQKNDGNWVKSDSVSNQGFQSEAATIWRDFAQTEKSITVSGGEQITGPLKITKDKIDPQDSVSIAIYDANGIPLSKEILGENNPIIISGNLLFDSKDTFSYKKELTGLTPNTSYTISIKPNLKNYSYLNIENKTPGVPTRDKEGQLLIQTPGKQTSDSQEIVLPNKASNMPSCGLGNPMGCVAQFFYYVLFVPTSYLFALSGVFFDSTFAYSVQDTSYRSTFVVEGWGLVRDFCNMFFIFILLYVAISTTLGLHGAKTKETIINIVIIGLFINFSLFATQLIIDASNITARVFYNADSIKITEKGVDGAATVIAKVGEGGVIPLSSALVNKVNPQNLILRSKEINNIPDKGGVSTTDENAGNIGVSSFILIVIIASAVNIVGFIVFLSVGMIFIARVIGLWLAMIIAPLAFFTYIMPEEMAGIKMIGWKNWWPETLKLAFLAPVFIFFMYIILKFLELDLISDSANRDVVDVQSGLGFFVATLIPFAFIMILMMKAKKIATDMSGELGQQITSKLSAVGGLALGAATGGAAILGRATLGRAGSALANSKFASTSGAFGRKLQDVGKWAGSGSFDARKTKAGAAFSKETGIDLMGAGTGLGGLIKPNEGGFTKMRADKTIERQKRAKDLEVHEDEKLKQDKNKLELQLKDLQDHNHHEIDSLEGKITAGQTDSADKSRRASDLEAVVNQAERNNGTATPEQIAAAKQARQDATKASNELQGFKDQKTAIKKGTIFTNSDGEVFDYSHNTADGLISKEAVTSSAKNAIDTHNTANDAETAATTATANIATLTADATRIAATARAEAVRLRNIANTTLNLADITAANQADAAATTATANIATVTADATRTAATARAEAVRARNVATAAGLTAGNIAAEAARTGMGKSMNDLQFEDIPNANTAIAHENMKRKTKYAKEVNSDFNKVVNFIQSGGQHSGNGAREAEYKIRMEAKVESGGGHSSSGGGHSAPAHHTPTPAVHTPAQHTTNTSPAGGAHDH